MPVATFKPFHESVLTLLQEIGLEPDKVDLALAAIRAWAQLTAITVVPQEAAVLIAQAFTRLDLVLRERPEDEKAYERRCTRDAIFRVQAALIHQAAFSEQRTRR